MSLTTPRLETDDDDVQFGVAARALGSRARPIERMVKRGQLERGPSSARATVSKRSLLAALEQRRRDVSHLTQAAEIEQGGSGTGLVQPGLGPSTRGQRCARSVLAPLLDEFVAVQTSGVEGRRRRDRRRRAASARSPTPNATASSAPTRAQRRRAAAGNARRPRKREAGSEYEHATCRAGRLGLLPPRDRRRRGPAGPRAARLSLEPAVGCARRRWPAGRLS